MRNNISAATSVASFLPVRAASESRTVVRTEASQTSAVQSESDFCECFRLAARQLLGSDPGLALHVLTGISESSGYRYAGGDRPVTGYILWQLLRSDQGWQWLSGIMDGAEPEWWSDTKRARQIKDAIDGI